MCLILGRASWQGCRGLFFGQRRRGVRGLCLLPIDVRPQIARVDLDSAPDADRGQLPGFDQALDYAAAHVEKLAGLVEAFTFLDDRRWRCRTGRLREGNGGTMHEPPRRPRAACLWR